jgi:hypothetical protein
MINNSTPCLICRKPVPGYEPVMCCDGFQCGCYGIPTNPCLCSEACSDALFNNIGYGYDERRKIAGIELYQEPKA